MICRTTELNPVRHWNWFFEVLSCFFEVLSEECASAWRLPMKSDVEPAMPAETRGLSMLQPSQRSHAYALLDSAERVEKNGEDEKKSAQMENEFTR